VPPRVLYLRHSCVTFPCVRVCRDDCLHTRNRRKIYTRVWLIGGFQRARRFRSVFSAASASDPTVTSGFAPTYPLPVATTIFRGYHAEMLKKKNNNNIVVRMHRSRFALCARGSNVSELYRPLLIMHGALIIPVKSCAVMNYE